MGSLLERLEAREATTRARVEQLQAEMDALAERLAGEQELLGRLEITRRTILEVLAGGDGDGEDAGLGGGVGTAPASPDPASLASPVAATMPAAMGVTAAADIDAFYQTQAPMPSTDDTLLCLSVDGKGVVMRPEALREATRKAAAVKPTSTYRTRLASGEKQGRKRMATLGTVYDADPAPRRPHDVLGPAITLNTTDRDRDRDRDHRGDGGRRRRQGPTATGKWLTGSIQATPPAGHRRRVRPGHPA
jgi:hypothetical protein